MDIIFFALARWDGPYSSTAYSLAKEFSKNHRVFYIDNPITFKYLLTKFRSPQIKKRRGHLLSYRTLFKQLDFPEGELFSVTPRLTIPINFLPEGSLYNMLSGINDALVFSSLKELLKKFHIENYIFINCFNPFYLTKFPAFFRPTLSVYISVDDIRHSLHISRHGERLENAAVQRADITFTTSMELKRLKSTASQNVFYLPNAADVDLFKTSHDDLACPIEIEHIKKPIVIYTGHLDHRIDCELLTRLIKSQPDYVFLFVGPVSIKGDELAALKGLQNVIFTGKRDITELPAFLKYSKCAIIPFKCNDLMKSIYPLKINEYLAAGKPVVSTRFSDDIEQFGQVITMVDNVQEFSEAIQQSIISDSQEKIDMRLKFVEANTWEARVALFWQTASPFIRR